MGVLDRALAGASSLVKMNMARPPVGMGYSGGYGFGSGLGIGGFQGSRAIHLEAMSASGWVFTVVNLIATSQASITWKLMRRVKNGDTEEVFDHPILDFWKRPNPFYTRGEFIETGAQYFELTGETWWVILYNASGFPAELWPVRPDRMRPIPHHEKYIAGYVYTLGSEQIPLETTDVIFNRRPHPSVPYRGIGQIQAIYPDIEAEKMAGQWSRNFYSNSAEPGGIIEYDKMMSDTEFKKLSMRWQEQHQGVGNAHRVAILERGVWKDRKVTQRDMQFEANRRLNRDIILGVWGIPQVMAGVSESTNRANAEAAEYQFAKWVLLPRMQRLQDTLNAEFVPLYRDPTLFLEFENFVPADRAFLLEEGERGYNGGLLTQNEGRRRLGEGEVEGGDEFKAPPPAPTGPGMFGENPGNPSDKYDDKDDKDDKDDDDPTKGILQAVELALGKELDRLLGALRSPEDRQKEVSASKALEDIQRLQEIAIGNHWARRLEAEQTAILAHLEQFKGLGLAHLKIELTDLEAYDWDWWTKYGDEVVEELSTAFQTVLLSEFVEMAPAEAIRLATEYATHRAGVLLRLDGAENVVAYTRARVRTLVAENIAEGQGLGTLQRALRQDLAFSASRAATVARTETGNALGAGSEQAAIAQGLDQKSWVSQGDELVCPICRPNVTEGWIEIGDAFGSGHTRIPAHPNDRCRIRYRTRPVIDPVGAAFHCPVCAKLVGKGVKDGETRWCPRCKQDRTK